MWIGHRREILKADVSSVSLSSKALKLIRSDRRGANTPNVSFRISFRWQIHITVSLETNALYWFLQTYLSVRRWQSKLLDIWQYNTVCNPYIFASFTLVP